MKIYKTRIDGDIIHNNFKTEFFIDTKLIKLWFNLNMFTCAIYLKEQSVGTLDLENNKLYDGGDGTLNYILRHFTNRQFEILRKNIKKTYIQILKIKYNEICGNDFVISDEHLNEYEKYRKIIDRI